MSLRALSLVISLFGFPASAQTLDLTITDPDQIAAECGGTAQAGEALFVGCAACHALQPGEMSLPGPHLGSLFGREVASVDGYSYSADLVAMGEAGTIWERETLHAFLEVPTEGHPAVDVEQDRRDILTYLRTATLPPPPKPGELDIPEEVFAIVGDIAYGEYLGGECMGCHLDGAQGVPAIKGLDTRYFITVMHEYRARARENSTMRLVAARLADDEIAALAAYFATLE